MTAGPRVSSRRRQLRFPGGGTGLRGSAGPPPGPPPGATSAARVQQPPATRQAASVPGGNRPVNQATPGDKPPGVRIGGAGLLVWVWCAGGGWRRWLRVVYRSRGGIGITRRPPGGSRGVPAAKKGGGVPGPAYQGIRPSPWSPQAGPQSWPGQRPGRAGARAAASGAGTAHRGNRSAARDRPVVVVLRL